MGYSAWRSQHSRSIVGSKDKVVLHAYGAARQCSWRRRTGNPFTGQPRIIIRANIQNRSRLAVERLGTQAQPITEGNTMSNVVGFLECVGQDAQLRHASKDELDVALTG